jgi:hypothetical protein
MVVLGRSEGTAELCPLRHSNHELARLSRQTQGSSPSTRQLFAVGIDPADISAEHVPPDKSGRLAFGLSPSVRAVRANGLRSGTYKT